VDQPTSTLIAASIAALSSLWVLIGNTRASRCSEMRVAHRKALEPHVAVIGEALHNIIATSSILLKAKTDVSINNWRIRSADAQTKLKEIRPKVRYSLWGIDEGIRTITRIPNWVEHARIRPTVATSLLSSAGALRCALDHAIRHSYSHGTLPSWWACFRVTYHAKQCRKVYAQLKSDQITDDEQ
jgi:hypothetical protein